MKIIISPAKSLDFKTKPPILLYSKPQFLNRSIEINTELKRYSSGEISSLMKISKNLGDLNYQRNQDFTMPFDLSNSKQAIFAFTGDVYKGLDINTLKEEKLDVLQDKLRILSGLYGILKPLDLIQPYRLEMGTKLTVGKAKNLYEFWDNTLVSSLNKEMEENEILVNLASNEYSKAVPKSGLKANLITPVFKELKGGKYKIIAIYAKKARGLMARYIIDNNIETIEQLKMFTLENYGFSSDLSSENELVFIR